MDLLNANMQNFHSKAQHNSFKPVIKIKAKQQAKKQIK